MNELTELEPASREVVPVSPAALHELLKLMGHDLVRGDIEDALLAAGNPRFMDGRTGLAGLSRVFQKLGVPRPRLAATMARMLKEKDVPALVAHEGRAWVLCSLHDGMAQLDDGSGQRRQAALDTIASAPTIWIDHPHAGAAPKATGNARKLIVRALLVRKRVFFEIAVATLLTSLLTIVTAFFAMQVYDRVIPTLAYSTLWALVGIVGIMIVFDFILKLVRAKMLDRVSREVDVEVSNTIFNALLNARLDARPRAVGTLAAQVAGLEGARAFFASGVLFSIAELPFAIIFLLMIGWIGGPMALVYVAIASVAFAGAIVSHFRMRNISRRQVKAGFIRNGILVESIMGAETLKASSADWRYANRWNQVTEDIADMNLHGRGVMMGATTLTTSLASIGYVGAIVMGVDLIAGGSLTTGGLIACTILGSRVISPISSGVGLIVQAQHVGQSLRAADALLDLPGESGDADDLLSPNEIRNSLTAENVRFFYTDIPVPQVDVPALEIAEGERVVLIGPPGSGKSTLLKILAGLYKPNEGRVLLGGVDIGLLDVERLREVVGYLPQDAMLFSGTLRDNLALGGAVNDDDLINLVRDLGLDELVQDHPRGLDREITEGGAGLSGGQRQMASLARLMLRRPRIWLLDEPTAGLDSGYEARVFGVLAKVLQPRDTVVIVSHRPQSIKFAQRVIVMQKGRVVHSGEREDFLARMRAASLRGREENE
jgi:ATP-binding cassette subfamily C protein LapB